MSAGDDVSWAMLAQIVREQCGSGATLIESRPLHGGMINTTLLLTLADNDRLVLKISPHRVQRAFADEAEQLRELAVAGMPTPTVHCVHLADLDLPASYLLMSHVEGITLDNARRRCDASQWELLQHDLASCLAKLHAHTCDCFRRVRGHNDDACPDWPTFYRAVFEPVVAAVEEGPHVKPKTKRLVRRVHDRLDRLIAHDDVPRLIHGDLWSTNVLADTDAAGQWHITALLDPAAKYGHAEAELAYIELFHTAGTAFRKAYARHHPTDDGYARVRRCVYQLYPLLNHVQFFGEQYVPPMLERLDRLAAMV